MAPLDSSTPDPPQNPVPPQWLAAAQRGAVILTSNQRAARFLHGQANQFYRATGWQGWPTPFIFNWNAWLADAWNHATWNIQDAPLLLSSQQEHALWSQLIAASSDSSPLTHDALAELAQEAWALLHSYSINLSALARASAPRVDWQKFSEWAETLQRRIRKAEWITQAELAGELRRRLLTKEWGPPRELLLWGFDEFTPAQESLLQAAQQTSDVTRVPASHAPSFRRAESSSLVLPSRADEFGAAARWAASRLKNNPASRLAIITTKAAEDRGALRRALSLELAPEQFEFSLGRPLANFSLVRTGLLLLRFERAWLTPAHVSDLLLSTELAFSPEERNERALFEANAFRRREAADPAMDLSAFTSWLRGAARRPGLPSLHRLLRQCEAALRLAAKSDSRLGAEGWADHFSQILLAFAYPASALSSVEYQTWERWGQLLQSFAATSISGELLRHAEAVARLSRMASKTIFQPESGEAAVEIMGPLEAAGSLFDGVFFAGCTDNRWPLPVAPNPLLPAQLQREAGMPGVVPGAKLERALHMTERILRSAPEVFFACARRDKDGELRPSPVLARLKIAPAAEDVRDQFCAAPLRQAPVFAVEDDTVGPSFPAAGPTLSTSALRSQAACPFQAFALNRLHARGEDLPEEGFAASQRGKMLHDALAYVWGAPDGLQTSQALRTLIDNGGLAEFVKLRVQQALPDANDGWQREYLQIERDRLNQLICDWLLKVEAARPPFAVREAEKSHDLELIAGLKFRVRPDRVDELTPGPSLDPGTPASTDSPRTSEPLDAGHGELVLLDYKTGRLSKKEWNTPRMDEPQLPLYALYALPEEPAAIALAGIRGGEEPGVRGIALRSGILPGLRPMTTEAARYEECLAAWRNDLEELAHEFAKGAASVDPKYGAETCRNCTLQPLCRIHETESRLDRGDDEYFGTAND